jgi:hypothetical protein
VKTAAKRETKRFGVQKPQAEIRREAARRSPAWDDLRDLVVVLGAVLALVGVLCRDVPPKEAAVPFAGFHEVHERLLNFGKWAGFGLSDVERTPPGAMPGAAESVANNGWPIGTGQGVPDPEVLKPFAKGCPAFDHIAAAGACCLGVFLVTKEDNQAGRAIQGGDLAGSPGDVCNGGIVAMGMSFKGQAHTRLLSS